MTNIVEQSEIHHLLLKYLDFSNKIIIGIDGYDGCGKTFLANILGSNINAAIISVDDYIEKHKDCYVSALDIARLCGELENRKGALILEGTCLLSVAERLGISLSCHVYIKLVTEMGIWRDEEECTPQKDPEILIKKLENQIEVFNRFISDKTKINSKHPEAGLSGLRKEIIRYHSQYNPVEAADYVVNRKSI